MIICHHCGRNFSHDYWASSPTLEDPKREMIDMWVCPNCCRDTNPNVGPSMWRPSPRDKTVVRVSVYEVRRECKCGAGWVGRSFTEPVAGEVRPGMCAPCAENDDAITAQLSHPIVDVTPKDTELEPPRPVRDVDEDQGFLRPRLVGRVE